MKQLLKNAYHNFISLGIKGDIDFYKKIQNKDLKEFFKYSIDRGNHSVLTNSMFLRTYLVTIFYAFIISIILGIFLSFPISLVLGFFISIIPGQNYFQRQRLLIINEIEKIDAEDINQNNLNELSTITINGIQSELFEEDIIEAIKNTDAKSILPYKKQLPYYNKITSKEEKDRLLMVFVSALVTSHKIVWNEKFYQDGESMIKKMPDVGTFSSLNKILDNKDLNEINTKNLTIIENQEKILFLISDAIHNIGNNYFKEKNGFEINNEDFMEQIGFFFALTRRLSRYIKNEKYSNKEYLSILHFIEIEFHESCHYQSQTLDLEKYRKLIK